MPDDISLALLYKGWETYQQHLINAIRPLTSEQLAIQIAPHLRSVMTLAAHIIATRVWWFHFVMREGSDELEPMVEWDEEGMPARTASELVHGLNLTWGLIQTCLSRWTLGNLPAIFQRPGSGPVRTYTRQWIIWHVIEHDLHHGGELSFALGVHGIPAIDL